MLQSAWVGDMRAARRAGQSPATAPINDGRADAATPGEGWDDHELVLGGGVDGCGENA